MFFFECVYYFTEFSLEYGGAPALYEINTKHIYYSNVNYVLKTPPKIYIIHVYTLHPSQGTYVLGLKFDLIIKLQLLSISTILLKIDNLRLIHKFFFFLCIMSCMVKHAKSIYKVVE